MKLRMQMKRVSSQWAGWAAPVPWREAGLPRQSGAPACHSGHVITVRQGRRRPVPDPSIARGPGGTSCCPCHLCFPFLAVGFAFINFFSLVPGSPVQF